MTRRLLLVEKKIGLTSSQVAEVVSDKIIDIARNDWESYIDEDGDIKIDEQCIFEEAFNKHIEYLDVKLSEYEYDTLYDAVYDLIENKTYDTAYEEIEEIAKDVQLYHRDPLKYHGLNQKDFL
ncbi:hypothetical protein SP15_290 [Bacillus phage SP-15]|uniref:Uncharacterized protein n=1 Tax=Bacillus phage SP-15 TaxID=1792032 RepID=A0A127AWQ6_9CAUD|nr:hypothetical protein SP15_290 [Bacillus phage SP-15]AMM45098.1 hypothetical protein SP15_290 [Bacillus phage SP-15]